MHLVAHKPVRVSHPRCQGVNHASKKCLSKKCLGETSCYLPDRDRPSRQFADPERHPVR